MGIYRRFDNFETNFGFHDPYKNQKLNKEKKKETMIPQKHSSKAWLRYIHQLRISDFKTQLSHSKLVASLAKSLFPYPSASPKHTSDSFLRTLILNQEIWFSPFVTQNLGFSTSGWNFKEKVNGSSRIVISRFVHQAESFFQLFFSYSCFCMHYSLFIWLLLSLLNSFHKYLIHALLRLLPKNLGEFVQFIIL
jgi:hypothetical protein